jgi:chromosomal replication initiation ATPase DnaA
MKLNLTDKMKKIPLIKIKEAVAKTLNVSVEDIESRDKHKMPVMARQLSMHYALRGRTLVAVGKEFNRHHGNVHYADEKIESLKDIDWEVKRWTEEIEEELLS